MTLRLGPRAFEGLAQGRLAILVVMALATACSKPQQAAAPAAEVRTPPPAATAAKPGTISGTAAVAAPGAAVIVVLEPSVARDFPAQAETPVMDQVGQTFGPAVLFVRTGQPVEFRNSDDTLHNVHVNNEETHADAFNVAIPTGTSYSFKFPADGFYHVGCDIHPAMAAEIVATSTPYATLADADGRFTFDDVPPGMYTLTVYAAGSKTQRDVEMKGAPVSVDVRSGT